MVTKLKCSFCNREVKGTVHSRSFPEGFKVDYYLVWTGKLIPMIMKSQKDERELVQFYRIQEASPLVACQDCYEKEEIKAQLEKAFTEVPEKVEPGLVAEEDEEEE